MRISDWSSDVCSSDLLSLKRLKGEGTPSASTEHNDKAQCPISHEHRASRGWRSTSAAEPCIARLPINQRDNTRRCALEAGHIILATLPCFPRTLAGEIPVHLILSPDLPHHRLSPEHFKQ